MNKLTYAFTLDLKDICTIDKGRQAMYIAIGRQGDPNHHPQPCGSRHYMDLGGGEVGLEPWEPCHSLPPNSGDRSTKTKRNINKQGMPHTQNDMPDKMEENQQQ